MCSIILCKILCGEYLKIHGRYARAYVQNSVCVNSKKRTVQYNSNNNQNVCYNNDTTKCNTMSCSYCKYHKIQTIMMYESKYSQNNNRNKKKSNNIIIINNNNDKNNNNN